MPSDAYPAYQLSDPCHNRHFLRPVMERAYSAAELDRLADAELAHGHVALAERLAWRAAAMREGNCA